MHEMISYKNIDVGGTFMKHGLTKKGLALTLAVSMGVGLTACGGEATGGKADKNKRYFKAEYQESLPDTFSETVNTVVFSGDSVYYSACNDSYTKRGIYAYNILNAEAKTIWEQEDPDLAEGEVNTEATKDPSYFAVDKDGNIYVYFSISQLDEDSINADYSQATLDDVINYMVESWGYDESMAEEEWNEYLAESYVDEEGNPDYEAFMKEMAMSYIYTNALEKYDASGSLIYSKELDKKEGETTSCYGLAIDGDGYLYTCVNAWSDDGTSDRYYLDVLDAEGNSKGQIEFDDYISNVLTLADGTVAAIGYGNVGMQMSVIDRDKMEAGEAVAIGAENMIPLDEKNMLMAEGTSLYTYNLEDQSKAEYLNWMDCNISSSSVSSFGMLSDGNLAVHLNSWSNSTGASTSDIVILKEIDESEASKVTSIDVACMWVDSEVEEKAIEFNKKHDDYKINIIDYSSDIDEEAEWEDMLNSFTTAVASDTDIDIVIFNDYSQVTNFAAKGLMIDLYELIDSDQVLKREDFLQNVLTACEQDGKLVTLPTYFSLFTVVGKAADVGTEAGWTLDEMLALLESKPEGTELFYGMTREQALSMCLSLGYNQYINWNDATCNFNSQEFIDVLEFANMFPEEFEYEEEVDEAVLMNEGKVLLTQYYLGDFEQIQMYTEVFGGDVTYIGYPTTEGNGAMLAFNNMYGITKNCKEKDAAWEFVREFYLPTEKTADNYYSYYGFSVRQDDFDYYCEQAMSNNGNVGGTWGWGSFEVEIKPATQAQVDGVKELVNGTTAVSGAVSNDMLNLIKEEAAFYFSGEQSAEDVAAKIQSRMEIYLSETK